MLQGSLEKINGRKQREHALVQNEEESNMGATLGGEDVAARGSCTHN